MARARISRRHLAAAVTVALAVTVGTLAAPAVATGDVAAGTTPSSTATATATATEQDATTATTAPAALAATGAAVTVAAQSAEDVLPFPDGAAVVGAGRTGFLTSRLVDGKTAHAWTRYADGSTTAMPAGTAGWGNGRTDVVTKTDGSVHTLYDMATDAEPVVIDLGLLGEGYRSGRGIGPSTLVATKATAAGGSEVHVISKVNGTLVDHKVTGLPENAPIKRLVLDHPGTLVVRYSDAGDTSLGTHIAVVDVEKHAVVDAYETPRTGNYDGDVALSATHIAWIERPTSTTTDAVVVRRDTGETKRVPLGQADVLNIELAGDWLLYGQNGGLAATQPKPLYALTARSLTSGETVRLLDHFMSAAPGPDSTQLVRGGTVADGEGLYRIALGPDGRPGTELVASTGGTTVLGVKDHDHTPIPTVVDFARGQDATLGWEFDKATDAHVVLTHTASGKRWTSERIYLDRPHLGATTWTGMFDDHSSAYNGTYTWKLTAKPLNGIGPSVERTGTLKVTSRPAPHDFSDSGVPDLLVKDSAGRLINYDARQALYEAVVGHRRTPVVMGTGWQVYDRVAAPGNLDASPYADVIGRDRTGALWLHSGTGHTLAPRKKIGGGWQIYNQLTGGSDLTRDGRADLVATDKAGDLYLYKGTGNGAAPFAPRKKIGYGWGIYNTIAAVGDIGGNTTGDLVARDKAGVLWLHLGNGDGTFAKRTRIGGGWDRYSDIVGVGDIDRDGDPDLVVQGVAGGSFETLSYYEGTGDWDTPFGPRREVYSPEDLGTGYFTLF